MCKVFGVAGVNDKNRGDVLSLVKEITPFMVKHENHGFGYAAITEHGDLFGEKWLKVDHAWNKRIVKKPVKQHLDEPILKVFSDVVDMSDHEFEYEPSVYTSFGNVDLKKATAFILHSRFATTGDKVIENVHPFVKEGTALVHNGVVYNDHEFPKTISSCDSEIMLNQYVIHGINMDSRGMSHAYRDVKAYFACLALSQTMIEDQSFVPIMDVFLDRASLELVHIHELGVNVFITDAKHLYKICNAKKWTTSRPFQVLDDYLIRVNAVTGEVMEKESFHYMSESPTAIYQDKSEDMYDSFLKSRYGENWKLKKEEIEAQERAKEEHEVTKEALESTEKEEETDDIPSYRDDYMPGSLSDDERGMIYDATTGLPDQDILEQFRHHANWRK